MKRDKSSAHCFALLLSLVPGRELGGWREKSSYLAFLFIAISFQCLPPWCKKSRWSFSVYRSRGLVRYAEIKYSFALSPPQPVFPIISSAALSLFFLFLSPLRESYGQSEGSSLFNFIFCISFFSLLLLLLLLLSSLGFFYSLPWYFIRKILFFRLLARGLCARV